MKKFIYSLLLFLVILVLPPIIVIVFFQKDIPGPKITISYSFNEKMRFLEKQESLQTDVISVGSSITLNNTHSSTITEMLNTDSYLNISAWGLRVSNVYYFTKSMLNEFKPRKIIFTANVVDFYPPEIYVDMDEIKAYITEDSPLKFQLKYFEVDYFFRRLYTNSINYESRKIYMSLAFDKYGAVLLEKEGFEKNENRWAKTINFEPIIADNYLYLDSLASLLSVNNIELIFIQTPIREGIITEDYSENIVKHVSKVQSILGNYSNTYFVDATTKIWNDSLFVDSQHFNNSGSEEFSKFWISEYLSKNK